MASEETPSVQSVKPPPLPPRVPMPVDQLGYETQHALPPMSHRSLVMALSLAVLSCPAVTLAMWRFVVVPIYPAPMEVPIVASGGLALIGMCFSATAAGHVRGQGYKAAAWSAMLLCMAWVAGLGIYGEMQKR